MKILNYEIDDKKTRTIGMTLVAIAVLYWIWHYYTAAPWTRDGKVRVDVIPITPDVAGRVMEVRVHDNQIVKEGDVLFVIDQARLKIQLAKTEAMVASAQRNREVAQRELKRYSSLKGIVSDETQLQRSATAAAAEAAYLQAIAERDLAALNLERSEIKAPMDGVVTNFQLRPGAYANIGVPVMAFVATKTTHVAGYFEETKLSRIQIGSKARIRIMGEPGVIEGVVESITYAIEDRERTTVSGTLLPNVNPTFSWIRLPQRVPVRIKLTKVPDHIHLVMGRTATVEIIEEWL